MTCDVSVSIPLYARDGSIRAYAVVDAADADWVNQWRWRLSDGYAKRDALLADGRRRRGIYLHRVILGIDGWAGLEGDHINRDRLDNRKSNLRAVTHAENQQNVGSIGATSRHRGVARRKQRWEAYVGLRGKKIHLGYFADEMAAAEAARDARVRLMTHSVEAGGV